MVSSGSRAGDEFVLLDFGDLMEKEPQLPIAQETTQTSPLFSPFGHVQARGGAKTSAAWTRRRDLESFPRTQALLDHWLFPWGDSGTLTAEIDGGATFAWDRSAVSAISPDYPPIPGTAALLQSYSANCGPMRLVAGPVPPGTRAYWQLLMPGVSPSWAAITRPWTQMQTTPINL